MSREPTWTRIFLIFWNRQETIDQSDNNHNNGAILLNSYMLKLHILRTYIYLHILVTIFKKIFTILRKL